jgi:hypothetical protein
MRKSGAGAIVRLTKEGVQRVLDGAAGMVFQVDIFTKVEEAQNGEKVTDGQLMAHVKDYRFPGDHYPYQIWSLGERDYEMLVEPRKGSGCECCDHPLQHAIRQFLSSPEPFRVCLDNLKDALDTWEEENGR